MALNSIESQLKALYPLPGYVVSVGELVIPPATCFKGEMRVVPRTPVGPWYVDVHINGPAGGPYARPEGYRVRIEFTDDFPKKCPTIAFMSIIHHLHLDKHHRPDVKFFDGLKKNHEISNLLQALHSFLAEPLHDKDTVAKKWTQIASFNKERNDDIQAYMPMRKYPALFDTTAGWLDEWLDPELLTAVAKNQPAVYRTFFKWETDEVYSFPMFTDKFCDMLTEELEGFCQSGLPIQRPNSMNNYGVVVNEIGMEGMMDLLQQRFLQPMSAYLYDPQGWHIDRHHAFMVQYQTDQDTGLDMHTDDSDVTFNVCLGKDFEGAGLTFCGVQGAPDHRQRKHRYKHVKGRCVVHLGRKRHGADDLTKGERRNLVIWNQSSAWRASESYRYPTYVKEAAPPDPHCVSYTHDKDYGIFKEYPPGMEDFRGQGWCPPDKKAYDGFVADDEVKKTSCFLISC